MVCLICGKSISTDSIRNSKYDKKLSHFQTEILNSWKNECAAATCQVLFDDKSDYFIDYFQNSDYCSGCEQVVRDLGFTWKQIQSFQAQILQLFKTICSLLTSNYQKIEGKSDITVVHSRMSYLLHNDGPLPFSIYSCQEMLEIIYSFISIKEEEGSQSHSNGSPLWITKKIIPTSSQMKPTSEMLRTHESLKSISTINPDSDPESSQENTPFEYNSPPGGQSPNDSFDNVIIKAEEKFAPENVLRENCSGDWDGSAMEGFNAKNFENQDLVYSDVDDNASENSCSSGLSAKRKKKIKKPSADSANKKKLELADTTESDMTPNETPLTPVCCTEDNCNLYFDSVQKMNTHVHRVHKVEKPHQCTRCPKRYQKYGGLRKHILKVHEKNKLYHSCRFCEKLFENEDDLKIHYSNSHQEPNPFKCGFCPQILENRENLINHTNQYHPKVHKDERKLWSCTQCQKKCCSPQSLKRHVHLVHEKGRSLTKYLCKFCGKNYGTEEEITLHYSNAHQEPNPFQCAFCPELCTNEKDLKQHVKCDHPEPNKVLKYKCDVCDQRFSTFPVLRLHRLQKHEDQKNLPNKCSVCEMTFAYSHALKSHMQKHESKLKCNTCEHFYPTSSSLLTHINNIHKVRSSKCRFCNTIIVGTKSQHLKHKNMHNKILDTKFKVIKITHDCKFCSRTYKNEEELNLHYSESHQGPNPFSCAFCPEIFSNSMDLRKHTKLVHPDPADIAAKVKCDVCNRYFTKACINRHKLLHRESEVIKCSLCSTAFLNSDNLKRHMEFVHSKDESTGLICETCGKTFKTRRKLNDHTKLHDGSAKNVKCKICDKTFLKEESCKRHERTHTDIKEFDCVICGRSFNNKGNLSAHIKIHTDDPSRFRKRKPKQALNVQSL